MIRLAKLHFLFALCGALLMTACRQDKQELPPTKNPPELPQPNKKPGNAPQAEPNTATNLQSFTVKGVVKEIRADHKLAKIKHEAIPNYMPAMTMDFEVRNTNELAGLKAGDVISFRMLVTDDDGWIDQVKKMGATSPTELPTRGNVRVTRDVEPLKIGEALPNYHFTNQLGQAMDLAQFKGNALAITFIFTSCPYPTFCPRMSQNFQTVEKKLKEMPDAPSNWHLLSISFDPEKDTPEVLRNYAERYNYDPKHWSFLTGDLTEITAVSDQTGQMFWREGGTINHNLRTVVIDAQGRLQKILPSNEWTPDELAEEIIKAAKQS